MLRKKIVEDMKAAMKAGDASARDTLRMLDSMIKNEEITAGKREEGLDDAAVVTLVKRAIKQRKDAAQQFSDAGRIELAAAENAEIAVIEEYLPTQMSDADVRAAVSDVIAQIGASNTSDMGRVMGKAMLAVGDGADGGRVKVIVEELLG